jgi:hypothetical protein
MDPLDAAILALRLALVLALYAFLVSVVRAATRSLRAAQSSSQSRAPVAPASAARPASAVDNGRLRLMLLEPGASGLPAGELIEVPDGATLGRAERANVVVPDPTVSAEHARLERLGDGWVVVDLGSTNGTLVNQALVQGDAALGPGDVLGLGQVRLKVVGSA